MADYTVVLTRKAEKQLNKLADSTAETILDTITELAANPRPPGYIKLKGRDGYRVRAGNYRIIYEVFDSELRIEIVTLGHRKDIYS